MKSKDLPFRLVKSETLSTLTMGEIKRWIEGYVQVLFPGNGLEYWTDGYIGRRDKTPLSELLTDFPKHSHVVASAADGKNEGYRIRLGLMNGGQYFEIVDGKSFGSMEECWSIARALYHAFECIFTWQEQPVIVDLAELITARPRRLSYTLRDQAFATSFAILISDHRIVVQAVDGESKPKIWSEEISHVCAAQFQVANVLHDWAILAKAFSFELVDQTAPGLANLSRAPGQTADAP